MPQPSPGKMDAERLLLDGQSLFARAVEERRPDGTGRVLQHQRRSESSAAGAPYAAAAAGWEAARLRLGPRSSRVFRPVADVPGKPLFRTRSGEPSLA